MPLRDLKLPDGLIKYSTTREFAEGTYPKALERDHSTKPGVWAVLHVTAGSVTFQDENLDETREIEAGHNQVILPDTLHSAKPTPGTKFFVEFYKPADEGQSAASAEEEL